jgi:hypothetical protein
MVRQRNPPSQRWRTFLDNHLKTLVSVDFFVVPTILFVFLVLAHERRRILHFAVTAHSHGRGDGAADTRSLPLGYRATVPNPGRRVVTAGG